jgi:hypothetical protein
MYSLRMFLADPELCLTEERSRILLEEYYLVYQYRVPVPDTVPKESEDYSAERSNQTHGNIPKSETSAARDLFFFPEKNRKINYESVSNSVFGHSENHGKNLIMPVRSAIYILKNCSRIPEDAFLELVRVLKILKTRVKMRTRMRRAVETVDEGEMEGCLRGAQAVRDREVRDCLYGFFVLLTVATCSHPHHC